MNNYFIYMKSTHGMMINKYLKYIAVFLLQKNLILLSSKA